VPQRSVIVEVFNPGIVAMPYSDHSGLPCICRPK
jgi:hypothetical protein